MTTKKPDRAALNQEASAVTDAHIRALAIARFGPEHGRPLGDRLVEARTAALAREPSQYSVHRMRWADQLEQQNDHLAFLEALNFPAPILDLVRAATKRIDACVDDLRGATDDTFDEGETVGRLFDIDLELHMIDTVLTVMVSPPRLADHMSMAIEVVRIVSEEISNGGPLPPKTTTHRRSSRARPRRKSTS